MLSLAFDTATDVATSALVWDGEVLGELSSRPISVLEDLDALLRRGGVRDSQLEGIVVGTGPGSFTSLRMGLATARTLTFALDVGLAGVSTLDALAAGRCSRSSTESRSSSRLPISASSPIAPTWAMGPFGTAT